MNVEEKVLARKMFRLKIHESDGQAFEDIFTEVMGYLEEDFQQIKPWGKVGDRKNDGYIKSKGIYYQVYAPEDIRKSYSEAVVKLKEDFEGLFGQWSPINEFYFVVNDKFKGVSADCEIAIQEIRENYKLKKAGILTAKDLENMLFKLSYDQISCILGGMTPDPASIKKLDYSILSDVITYIMKESMNKNIITDLVLPDWDEKVEYNKLSKNVATLLNNGQLQMHSLEYYLSNNSNFLADQLRDKLNEVYRQEKINKSGDNLFWAMVRRLSPRAERMYQITVITIMAKYFETCDIFEEPMREGSK